ncbi:phage protein Gp27 family protein, partial [Streptomyces sp. P17]|uniref:phage protein Gp27 family protein n=2 Tax=unclassified Streptomyces TaxID=2593676 RepID=UPI0028F3E216
DRTQTDIYAEFVARCEALMADRRGEVEFDIPSFSSFHRHAFRMAALARRLEEAREIGSTLSARFDGKGADDLTKLASQAIMALVLELTAHAGDAGWKPVEAMQLAAAMKSAAQAMGISTDRRAKVEAEFEKQVKAAVTTVARAKGLSAETAEAIKSEILGVE